MKFNNIDTLANNLQDAVNELANLRDELAKADTLLLHANTRANLAEVRAEQWEQRANDAEGKLARLEGLREQDFDWLVWSFADESWRESNAKFLKEQTEAHGARIVFKDAIMIMYQRSVNVLTPSDPDRLVIEVYGAGETPFAYYYWSRECVIGKFERKVEVK